MLTVVGSARVARRAGRALAGARATTTYLFALAVTSFTVQGANPRLVYGLIVSASTNLHNMVREPAQVLIASAFWLQGGWPAWALAAASVLVMVPAERWLGTWRWIGVFAAGHLGATLITVTGIAVALHHGWLPSEEARATDVGMSYGVVALAGALTSRWSSRRGRLGWVGTWLFGLGVAAALGQTFTDYGHLCALLIGLGILGFRPGTTVGSLFGRPTRMPTSGSPAPALPGRADDEDHRPEPARRRRPGLNRQAVVPLRTVDPDPDPDPDPDGRCAIPSRGVQNCAGRCGDVPLPAQFRQRRIGLDQGADRTVDTGA